MDHVIAQPPLAAVDFSVLEGLDDDPSEGQSDLVTELIDLYLGEVPLLIDSIRKGLEENNWKSARRAAQLSSIADKIERLEDGEINSARVLCEDLELEFARVTELLLEERQRRAS
jgi:hypothetical protein